MSNKIKKYYAVKVGKTPGIYFTWEDCLKQVNGYPNAIYKSFKTIEEANEFINSPVTKNTYVKKETVKVDNKSDLTNIKIEEDIKKLKKGEAISFVDGSYIEDANDNKYVGYGCVIITHNKTKSLSGVVRDQSLLQYRNVTGEIESTKQAIIWSINNDIKKLSVYYDYEGIKSWALGMWKTNNELTKEYALFFNNHKHLIDVTFIKVTSHTGIKYNDEVDELARLAIENEIFLNSNK